MEATFVAFGPVREAIGRKEVTRELSEGTTVGEFLRELAEEFPDLEVQLFGDGQLRDEINVTRNDKHVAHLDGLDTPLSEGDVVRAAPPVKGG